MAARERVGDALRAVATQERAKANAWFFKTGPGQYGEGDQFLGITVPQQRAIAKKYYKTLSLNSVEQLLHSPWHEERLTAVFMLVLIFQKGDEFKKDQIANLYLANTRNINNWDLVDSSASYILGPFLENNPYKMKLLTKLARSKLIWERRIAMLATLYYIMQGSASEAFAIIEILKNDQHDLIQKAVGWMLREIGKRVDRQLLVAFLNENTATMPRTSLRYAIEHFSSTERAVFMGKVVK